MASSGRIYANWRKNLGNKVESFSADTLKVALFTGSYTPAVDTDCAYQVNAPSAPTLSQVAGGSIGATTYYCKITYVNPAGETTPSSESNFAVGANNVLKVTSPSNPGGSVTGYNVYVSTTAGTETKQAGPINIGTDWTEPTSGLIAGSALPGSNTAQISGEVSAGNGYSTGGITLASGSWAKVLANSWADAWTANTAYTLGQMVRPASANGYIYKCVQAGSSGNSPPSWGTTLDGLTADNTVEWLCVNTSLMVLSASNLSWTVSAVISYRYAVLYDSTTNDLVALLDPGVTQTGPNSGNLQINWDSAGILWF